MAYMNPAEIEAKIAKDREHELAACDDLTQAYLARFEPWRGHRPVTSAAERILLLELGRQTKTYRAAIELCRRGYAEQAQMLNRALFESMVVLRWIAANEEKATGNFERAFRWDQHLRGERVNNTGWLEDDDEIKSDLTAEEIASFRAEFGKYGQEMWTGHSSVRTLLDDIKDQFSAEEWVLIQNYLRTGHQEATQLLHSTAAGLVYSHTQAEGRFAVWTGPSEPLIEQALFSAFFIYSQTLGLVVDRFEMAGAEDLRHQLAQASFVFERLPKNQEEPGRNDPCFCGSGRKYKRCHGA